MGKIVSSFRKLVCHRHHSYYWNAIGKGMIFVFHFMGVMIFLFLGAILLALLEDSEVFYKDSMSSSVDGNFSSHNDTQEEFKSLKESPDDSSMFWKQFQMKYNFTIHPKLQYSIWSEIKQHNSEPQKNDHNDRHHDGEQRNSRNLEHGKKFVIMKWFYFVVVASTTIGYGHVFPATDNGKLFYIFFSIIAIVLMMTLLQSCGKILMVANKKVYTVIRRGVFYNRKYASDELMSIITIFIMFLIFMILVVIHDKSISEVKDWSMVDTFYFWLVTFTTVGFGDVHFPLEVEIQHFYELLLYRVFGLSFLAAIIESIYAYIKYRRLILIEKSKPRLRKVAQVMIGSTVLQSPEVERMNGLLA